MKKETINFILDIIALTKEHGIENIRKEFASIDSAKPEKNQEITAHDIERLKAKKIPMDYEFKVPGINP